MIHDSHKMLEIYVNSFWGTEDAAGIVPVSKLNCISSESKCIYVYINDVLQNYTLVFHYFSSSFSQAACTLLVDDSAMLAILWSLFLLRKVYKKSFLIHRITYSQKFTIFSCNIYIYIYLFL